MLEARKKIMNTRSDTSRNPQSICRNPLASALRAWGWGFLFSVVALGGFVAIGGEEDNLKTGPSLLAPQPDNLQAWTAARDARIAEKQQFLAKTPAAPVGGAPRSEVTSETALVPLGATPKYLSSTGVENFEAAWPDSYWTVTGWPTWNDVNCITPYEGSWSAYCAGSSSSCAGYYNNMDAVMYTECNYYGYSSAGNNRLYYKINIPSIESCCDYLEIKCEGYTSQPPSGGGTPTATYTARWTSATSGWSSWYTHLPSTFDSCGYVRVSFRFHSDISNTGQGAYLDYIEFNNRTDTALYPIYGGFHPCSYLISPTSGSIAACGGSTSVSVSADSGCSWTASNPCSDWLTMSPSSGSGSGTVTLSASANNSGTSRSCTLTIAGTSYTVTQPSASISLYNAWWSNTTDVDGDGCVEGVAQLHWDADYSCSESVSVFVKIYYKRNTDSTWILRTTSTCFTITGATGVTHHFSYDMLDGTWDYRVDLLYCGETTVQDTFYLLDHCEETCGYSIWPTSWSPSVSSGSQVVTVTATTNCSWSVSNPCTSWLTVSPASGTGSGSVTVTAQANSSCSSRSCSVAIAGKTFTVNQAAGSGTFTISPTTWSPSASTGSQVVTVTAAAGCSWSVSNPCTSWLTVSPASGDGSASVTVTPQANTSCSTRTCSVTIAGNTFTVNQAAGSGTFTISPTTWSPSASSGSQVATVTASSGCSWSVSNPCTSWLTVLPMSGTGSGSVTITAQANTSCSTRTCSMTIAGNTFTVNQAAGSGTFTISPTGWNAPGGGGSQVVTVTAAAGCSWSVSNPCTSWLTVSPGSGTGSGSVTVTAAANNTASTRSCTVTIAGQVFSVTQPTNPVVGPCFVTRQLPAGYTPGVSLTLTEAAVPSQNTSVYAVEDLPPAGWGVGTISDGGTVDVNGKVKWGPFFDNAARSLTCQLTPPIGQTNRAFFSGTGSADGVNCSIGGSNYLDAIVVVAHPADGPCAGDMYMRIGEVTAYGAAWKNGTTWACQPNPIPISYVTRCGYLWKNGEHYCSDPLQAAPLCWYNCAKGAGVEGDKGASIVTSSINGCTVCLTATPDATTGVYAVEDTVPAGCTVSGITQNGSFDAVNHKVKWGPYFDNTPRTLCYTLSAGCSGTLSGLGSFDGVDVAITGQRQSCGAGPVLLSMDIYPGVTLTGTVGRTYRVEWSPVASGGTWTPVATVLLTNTTQLCVDTSSPCRTNRFYRAVQMP